MAKSKENIIEETQEETFEEKAEKEIVRASNEELAKIEKLYSSYNFTIGTEQPKEKKLPQKESEEHFVNGIVPAGFRDTYGDEVTDVEEGQVSELVNTFFDVFNKEDGFRLFLKYVDGNRFSVLIPLKFAQNDPNVDRTYLAITKCDCRSTILKPGNVKQQVELFAKRLAKRLSYQKGR